MERRARAGADLQAVTSRRRLSRRLKLFRMRSSCELNWLECRGVVTSGGARGADWRAF